MIAVVISFVAGLIIAAISALGYLGVVAMMAIESACIPLPSEIIMPFSGYLASTGRFTLLGLGLAGAVGCVIGSVAAWLVGKYGGRNFIFKYGKYLLISRHDLEMADRWFERYGQWIVFFSRLLPVIRTFISLPAGIARMRLIPFVAATFLGSFPWCYFLAFAGFKLGQRWETLGVYFHRFDAVIGALLLAGGIWWVWRHIRHLRET